MGVRKLFQELLRFELLWKLLFFCPISPVFTGIYNACVSRAGPSFNGNIWAVLNLRGATLFLLLFSGAAAGYSLVTRARELNRW